MSGCAQSAAPVCGPPVTTLITPLGSPASVANAANTNGETGASSEGFTTQVFQAANAAPIFLTNIKIG